MSVSSTLRPPTVVFDLSDVLLGGTGKFLAILTKKYGKSIAEAIILRFATYAPEPKYPDWPREPYLKKLFRGEMSEEDFFKTILANESLFRGIEPADVQEVFSTAVSSPIRSNIKLVQQLVANGCKVCFASDHVKEEVDNMKARNPELFALVADARCFWSFTKIYEPDIGLFRDPLTKDAPTAFLRLKRDVRINSEPIVYVGHVLENIIAAQIDGFHGILYRKPKQLKTRLEEIIGFKLE